MTESRAIVIQWKLTNDDDKSKTKFAVQLLSTCHWLGFIDVVSPSHIFPAGLKGFLSPTAEIQKLLSILDTFQLRYQFNLSKSILFLGKPTYTGQSLRRYKSLFVPAQINFPPSWGQIKSHHHIFQGYQVNHCPTFPQLNNTS